MPDYLTNGDRHGNVTNVLIHSTQAITAVDFSFFLCRQIVKQFAFYCDKSTFQPEEYYIKFFMQTIRNLSL